MGLTAPCQPLQAQGAVSSRQSHHPCPSDSPAGPVPSSRQPCPAHPWDLLGWAVSPFWPHPTTIPREVPNPGNGGCSWCSQMFCSWLDRAGPGLPHGDPSGGPHCLRLWSGAMQMLSISGFSFSVASLLCWYLSVCMYSLSVWWTELYLPKGTGKNVFMWRKLFQSSGPKHVFWIKLFFNRFSKP